MEQGETILIQTPYIICDKGMYQDLSELCRAGKQIEIITNAVESGANPWGCTDYLNERKSILKTGAGVYACMAGQSLHTKTVLIRQLPIRRKAPMKKPVNRHEPEVFMRRRKCQACKRLFTVSCVS